MGILDNLRGMFASEEKGPVGLFTISTKFEPFRLLAKKNNSVRLTVHVKNVSDREKMVSVLVACPKELGTTSTLVHKKAHKELGTMQPGDEKDVDFEVFATTSTPAKDYNLAVVTYSHFRDYEHVENAARRVVTLRAV